MKKLFLLLLMSILLISCSDNGSSNSANQSNSSNDTVVSIDGVTVRRSADGEIDIQDPNNSATITEQDDGTFLIESADGTTSQVGIGADGSITNSIVDNPQ